MISKLTDIVIGIVILVVIGTVAYVVLSNGTYYGAQAGNLVRGVIDLVSTFVETVAE